MVMIKAFGYGSGGYELAKLLSYHHVNYLGVAFADEGISLRNSGIQTPIMVLNPEISSFYSIIQHQLEPEIYNIRGLRAFLQVAKELGVQKYPVHLKLDTGMHRLGLEKIHLAELISLIKDNSLIKIQSILSHLATSDDISPPSCVYVCGVCLPDGKEARVPLAEADEEGAHFLVDEGGLDALPRQESVDKAAPREHNAQVTV